MKHRYHQPADTLDGYVRTILSVENISPADSLPILPQGTASLVCLVENETPDKERGVSLLLFTRSIDIATLQVYADMPKIPSTLTSTYSILAYFFHPFVAGPLFSIPAVALATHPEPLDDWNTKKAISLQKKLKVAQNSGERIKIMDSFLSEQLDRNRNSCEIIRRASDRIIENPSADLHVLLNELQISERTLQRVFKKYMGLSPGQFRRLCQFHSAFHQLRSREFGSLSDVAYDQGYADQSHFIRSFREFTSKNPGEYVKTGLSDSTK